MSGISKAVFITVAATVAAWAQAGPGPGPGGGPRPLQGLNQNEMNAFNDGLASFREIDSVKGTQPGANGTGLGPRFNGNSCAMCHAHPTMGGSSPAVNPQIALATSFGATNQIPQFIQQNGPVRVARFVRNPDGSPDGGVHDLFTIAGRSDAPGCVLKQPDFAAAQQQRNLSLRIPTPIFGAGLIEAIPDSTILANLAANQDRKRQMGIRGLVNRNGNDGTITRYGWKAQNKSLMIFAGEAYNVEQGVTNPLFPQERDETANCATNASSEDNGADLNGFSAFMRFLAPPPPSANPDDPSVMRGAAVFDSLGCGLCHTASLKTGLALSPALSNKDVRLYSDLALHNMGQGLADGVNQGLARGGDWRTAPLWGLGSRLFYLHDGRANDLATAITAHQSQGSEANPVIGSYNALPAEAKQDLLSFLRSL
jgi:CxxC motif-containing protein (DUF1111 family)